MSIYPKIDKPNIDNIIEISNERVVSTINKSMNYTQSNYKDNSKNSVNDSSVTDTSPIV